MKKKILKILPGLAAGNKGFTLLEVLAAVLILGLAYVAVLQNFSISLSNIEKIRKTRQTVFEELMAFSENIKFMGSTTLPADDEEEGTPFIKGEKYELTVITSGNGEMETLKLHPVL
ncbi:MAG: type II secretion system protein [Deltaproteobacteria bacterium]|nr:type II secretion system protein [Deltaproteobacteria bacterium]